MKKIWISSGVERTNSTKPAAGSETHCRGDMRRIASSRPTTAARMKPSTVASMVTMEASARRSEERTSELQSLMRNSYAVFCLKKQKKQTKNEQTATSKTQEAKN